MPLKHHTVEARKHEPDSSERTEERAARTSELIAKGDLLLEQLKHEAAAARAEAKLAKLEILLTQARLGNVQAIRNLKQWMLDQDALPANFTASSGVTAARADGPHARKQAESLLVNDDPDSSASGEECRQPQPPINSWDHLLPFAQARIKARAAALRDAANGAQEFSGPEPETSPEQKRILSEIASRLNCQQQEEQKQSHRRLALFSSLGGVFASVVAHVLLLVILAWVTLKLPSAPAGMAFESSKMDAAEEVFELTQPLEADVAEEITDPVPAEASTLEATNDLAELSSMLSETATDQMSPIANLASVAAAAQSALGAAASPMNAAASFFGAAAGGNCFCYIIDGSGSMRGGPWEAAKLELLKSLSSLKATQRFYIIFFNRSLEAITLPGEREPAPHPLYATPENLHHARRWVDSLTIGIGAPPNKALGMAISKEPDAIYLLTDGVTTADVAAFLRTENRITDLINGEQVLVPIHAIAFYSLKGQQLLRQIAQENKGQFVYVPDPAK